VVATELAARLGRRGDVEVLLVQGGPSGAAHVTRCRLLDRYRFPAGLIARLFGIYPTSVEHYSFGLLSLHQVLRFRPDVIVASERPLVNFYDVALGKLRRRPRLVLLNGGSHGPPFRHVDAVVHHAIEYYRQAVAMPNGCVQHHYVPIGFEIERGQMVSSARRVECRTRLGLPVDRPIVITVGAVTAAVKRMDHLVRSVHQLPEPRPLLLMVGQIEAASNEVLELARELLGPSGYRQTTVHHQAMNDYLAAANLFVLCSPAEGFGRAYIEAAAVGLPVIAHDTPHFRDLLGECGRYVDMLDGRALSEAMSEVLCDPGRDSPDLIARRVDDMIGRYSWDVLIDRYVAALMAGLK
jgi:glycosyltransferase involved in cell wall biosynthesis